MKIWLGFLEKFYSEDDSYLCDPTVSKIGGRPIWINSKVIPKSQDLQCGICKKMMRLLLQLYCPEIESPFSYHRVIYVFVCEDGSCQRSGFSKSFKVIRVQKDNSKDIDIETSHLCVVCNILGTYICSKCKTTRYCSKQHQKIHWELALHKNYCGTSEGSKWPVLKKAWWNEMEIICEVEPEETLPIGNELIQHKYGPNAIPDKFEKFSEIKGDKTFFQFQKRLGRAPTQILRYIRAESNDTEDSPILWISSEGQLNNSEIAKCPCGEKRTIEFQIMPTLLSFLNIDYSEKYSLDWGVLNVYTCEKNCMLANNNVCQELLWRQEISNEIISGV
ncbi:hypothetical protein PNEG_00738 [Pneumocystis murina B123]|uniref:MYND-type domain-containing protein n=1 Tax=Pneumocystis murina (strain B123) TaxID=1069680 RepID=M7NV16_PNEMU|nr:hypothetical protein PNEG_00738 [Pneumocystis murina B123]EMR11142.1 hypothetical protein PNEG_00738 [Pneumocystis murina B123]